MRISTVFRFLLGGRRAILKVASDRRAVLIGALFVLAAGLARNYDSEDLLHEPWWLLVPFAASQTIALAMFCLLRVGLRLEPGQRYWRTFPRFLGLFWMTAPLALLYAVPYDHFLSAGDATVAKLSTLAIVSGWRVLLMMRITSVLAKSEWTAWPVLFLANVAALVALRVAPLPVMNFMGGISHNASEQSILSAVMLLSCMMWFTVPVSVVGMLCFTGRGLAWSLPRPTQSRRSHALRAAIICTLVWLPVLPLTQPQQQLRRQAETLLRQGAVKEAVILLSSHQVGDLPPHWDPPPRVGYGEASPSAEHVLAVCEEVAAPDWVRHLFANKADRRDRRHGPTTDGDG